MVSPARSGIFELVPGLMPDCQNVVLTKPNFTEQDVGMLEDWAAGKDPEVWRRDACDCGFRPLRNSGSADGMCSDGNCVCP